MLKFSMQVSLLEADLDQQIDEEIGANPPGPQPFNETLGVNLDQLLVSNMRYIIHSVP